MSPGPSLAVVIRNTLNGNRMRGIVTGLAHGVGIVFYAFVTAIGVGVAVVESPALFAVIKYAGAGFLVWLAYGALMSGSGNANSHDVDSDINELLNSHSQANVAATNPVRDGLLISILNPKIILFFLALFSQFVRPDASLFEAMGIAATAGIIDAGWYVLVAVFVSHSVVMNFLRKRLGLIEKLFGVLLIVVAVRVLL